MGEDLKTPVDVIVAKDDPAAYVYQLHIIDEAGRDHSSNGNNGNGGGSSSNPVQQTNPNVPSTFVKDPNRKHSFYGLAYTPEGSQLPNCGANISTPHPSSLRVRSSMPLSF